MRIKDRLRHVNLASIFLIMSLLSCVAYLYQTAPPPGYCDITDSITPDEVFIEKAIAETGRDIRMFDGKNYSVLNCCLMHRLEGGFFAKLIRWDPGVWVAIAYERSQWAINRSIDKRRYVSSMAYSDSCGRYRPVDDDTRGPLFYGYVMPNNDYYRIPDKDEIPILDKKDLKYFVKWPK